MEYRLFLWTDIKEIVFMINEVWQLDQLCGSQDKGMIFSKIYLFEVLKDVTDIYVAVDQGNIAGMIMLSIKSHMKLNIPIHYQKYLNDTLDLLSDEVGQYKNVVRDYKKQCLSLLQNSSWHFDAEIVLFAVGQKYQYKEIGSQLFALAKEKFYQENCQSFYLYSDTSCNYEYYHNHNMKRLAFIRPDENAEFEIFLYGYTE